MSYVPVLVYVHILLMVFWIGSDIAVFIAGLRFMDPALSIAERNAVIKLGMIVDRYPRICFVAMLPVGSQISYFLGLLPLSAAQMAWVWSLSGIWLAAVVAGMMLAGQPQVRLWQLLERAVLMAVFVGCTAAGIAGLIGRLPIPEWLAGKLLAFGAICFFALLLDRAFTPVFGAFAVISTQGSTPDREAVLRRCMIRTYVWVTAIYAAVLLSGFLGTVKPQGGSA